jgi:hypothetical protein
MLATTPRLVKMNGTLGSTRTASAATGARASHESQVSTASPPEASGCPAARGTT